MQEEQATTTTRTSNKYGIDIFSNNTTVKEKRRYWIHALVYVFALLPTIWPLVLPFNRVEPYILGMPFNMTLGVVAVLVVFINTVVLYRFEHSTFLE